MIKSLAVSAGHLLGLPRLTPVYLVLGATWRCNARCVACFNRDRLNETDSTELTLEEHGRLARSLGPLAWLLFTGGEPVLRDDLDSVAETYYRHCGARRITLPTNALLPERTAGLAESMLSRCPDLRLAVSLAIDGVGEAHDNVRGVGGAFANLMRTYEHLADLKRREPMLSINLNTVLSNATIDGVPALMEHVTRHMPDVDFHGFEILRCAPDSLTPPTPEQYERLLSELIPYWSRFSFYRGPLRRLIRAAKIEARRIELDVLRGGKFKCVAGRAVAYVSPEGMVYFCEELDTSVGDLRESDFDFRRIWFGPVANGLRDKIRRERCSCTHSCFVGSSVLFDPKQYLSLFGESIKSP